jgi:hypothetical protein
MHSPVADFDPVLVVERQENKVFFVGVEFCKRWVWHTTWAHAQEVPRAVSESRRRACAVGARVGLPRRLRGRRPEITVGDGICLACQRAGRQIVVFNDKWLLRLGAAEADMAVHARAGEVQRTLHLMLIFGQHVGADDLGCLQIAAAIEAGRVIRVADTVVDGRLRIRAQRALHGPARGLRQNLVRHHPILHPFHERAEEILRLRPAAATAVPDAGRPEQPIEALQVLEVRSFARAPAEARRHLPIVVNDAARHD